MPIPPGALAQVHALLAASEQKEEQLRKAKPYLVDLSLRENPFGSRVGQTLEQKLAILPQLRAFGFENILLGTLDYAYPEHLEVDDDFMMHLRDHGIDMTGGFAFTDIGRARPDGSFQPSDSMLKLHAYKVPNTLHEIYLSHQGMHGQYDLALLKASLVPSIRWVHDNCVGDGGGRPRIIINVVDGCDAWAQQPDVVAEVFGMISDLPIDGVSLEDDRGTFMPFQVGAFVAATRAVLPDTNILVHMHAGAGFENASLIEALLSGANGVWGGLPKRAAIIGHASLGELIANLLRVGNEHVKTAYDVRDLIPLATRLQEADDTAAIPEDLPILGSNAYRITLDFFRQIEGRKMDLPPRTIGAKQGFRVAPLGSDTIVLEERLREVMGENGAVPPSSFEQTILETMILLMRQDLRDGTRVVYDEPARLMELYERARAHCRDERH